MRKAIEASIQAENEPLALISKKKNADLKKMLARKVEKLNKKTERSIVSLLSKLKLFRTLKLRLFQSRAWQKSKRD